MANLLFSHPHLYNQDILNVDIENLEVESSCRNNNIYMLTLLLTQEGLRNGSSDSELALPKVCLMLCYDCIYHLLAVIVVLKRNLLKI